MFTATAINMCISFTYTYMQIIFTQHLGDFAAFMETKTSPWISQMLAFVGTLFIVTYNQDFFSFASN